MKINQNVTYLNHSASPTPVAPGKVKAAAAQTTAATDPLRQSDSPSLLPSAAGDFNAARVAEIRESISAGRYQVNTARIADGLLSTVQALIGKSSS